MEMSITSVASRFVMTSNITTSETNIMKLAPMVMFSSTNTKCTRFVVKASEEAASGAISIEEDKSKPPQIGPKRGTKVLIILLREIAQLNGNFNSFVFKIYGYYPNTKVTDNLSINLVSLMAILLK